MLNGAPTWESRRRRRRQPPLRPLPALACPLLGCGRGDCGPWPVYLGAAAAAPAAGAAAAAAATAASTAALGTRLTTWEAQCTLPYMEVMDEKSITCDVRRCTAREPGAGG